MSEVNRIAGRYEQGLLIGRGAMGEVYRGRDVQTGEDVAIKVLRPHLVYHQPDLVERFRREAESLRMLNHPNIVKVLAAVEENDLHYLVMEFVAGGTLADLLQRQPQLPVQRALAIALELADALTRTHHLNIVHRDIKPANILIAEDGTPRLTDFGLALLPDEARLTQPGVTVGTWLYLSPESCAGATPSILSDVWSFGIVLYEMLAGRPPFVGDSLTSIVREITTSPLIGLADLRDDIPTELDKLIRRMLMKDAPVRISSFRQIGAVLESISAGRRGLDSAPARSDIYVQAPAPKQESVQIEVQWSDEEAIFPPASAPIRNSTPRLLTKLAAPPARPQLIPRERLLRTLDEGVRRRHGLILVSAPAGFGKTTLVSAWLQASSDPVAWFTLDATDNDLAQFLQYLVAALQQIDNRIGETTLRLLQAPRLPALVTLLTPLINDVATHGSLALVLDNYHTITAEPIHQTLRFLLEHLPPDLRLVILSREDPPLPLTRLRVRDQLTEIRDRDLRFNDSESAAFLNESMSLGLEPTAIEQLTARTEGWIAALQLAALAIQESPDGVQDFVAEFTGDNRYVMDYLLTEVLEGQTAEVRDFLRRTSVLDRLTAPLCDAVTGMANSGELLNRMAHSNLFIVPLDSRHTWYRYHQLFADVLRQSLTPAEAADVHRRASHWFETEGTSADAVMHALAAASISSDYADVARLIRAYAEAYINDGRLTTILAWLGALPDADVRADMELAADKAWALAMAGDLKQAADYASAAQNHLGAAPSDASRGKLYLVQSFILLADGDFEKSAQHARQTLAALPAQHPWRITALWVLAEAQERSAPIVEAIASLREATAVTGSAGTRSQSIFAAILEVSLASALNLHGQRREAMAICRQALARYTGDRGRPSPIAALALARLVVLHYEANEIADAVECLRQARPLAEQLAVSDVSAMLDGLTAMLDVACGELDRALSNVHLALLHASEGRLADTTWISAIELAVHLRRGDMPAAHRWVDAVDLTLNDAPSYLLVEHHCAFARLLLAQKNLVDAARWLAQLDEFVEARGYTRWRITVCILQALVAEQTGDMARANSQLAEALQLAVPGDYRRAFLDEDRQVLTMLSRVRAVAPDFVDTVLRSSTYPSELCLERKDG